MPNALFAMPNVKRINELSEEYTRTLQRSQLYLVIDALLCRLQDLDPERAVFISELAAKFRTDVSCGHQEQQDALLKCQFILDSVVDDETREGSGFDVPLAITMFIASILTTLNEYHPSAMGIMGLTGLYSSGLNRP